MRIAIVLSQIRDGGTGRLAYVYAIEVNGTHRIAWFSSRALADAFGAVLERFAPAAPTVEDLIVLSSSALATLRSADQLRRVIGSLWQRTTQS